MQRMMMKSKIHRATVTGADLSYQGSITIDPLLMEAADLVEHERVEIYNLTNGERLATYAIPGGRGAGEIVLNGAAAHKASPGDLVILCSYGQYEDEETATHEPTVIFVDERNRVTEPLPRSAPMPVAVG